LMLASCPSKRLAAVINLTLYFDLYFSGPAPFDVLACLSFGFDDFNVV